MQRATDTTWAEGNDGTDPRYRELLYPPVAVAILALALAGIVGVAYGAAYGAGWGWGVGAILGVLAVAVLAATAVPIRVDDRVLRAGRARLPHTAIAEVQPLDPASMRQARRHGDPRDYVVLRAWSSRRGVAVRLADPRDPHPRWIITTRHPERLADTIAAQAGLPSRAPAEEQSPDTEAR